MSVFIGAVGAAGAMWTGVAVALLVDGEQAALLGLGVGFWMLAVTTALGAIYGNGRHGSADRG